MAPFLLALIIFGVAARTNARPYPGDIPGDDEDGYDVDNPLSDVCRQGFIDNEPSYYYDIEFVNFMLQNICPLLLDDDEGGSGDRSSYWSERGLQILAITEMADIIDEEILYRMDDSTCKTEGPGQRVDFYCRFHQDRLKVSGVDGGSGSGSGSGDGSRYGSGDGSSDGSSGDGSSDDGYGFSIGSSDDGYGFSIYWSSMG